jgi:hypothetical protein
MIYKYGFTANEAIGFMRVVRPGSVVGPQQVSISPPLKLNTRLTLRLASNLCI